MNFLLQLAFGDAGGPDGVALLVAASHATQLHFKVGDPDVAMNVR